MANVRDVKHKLEMLFSMVEGDSETAIDMFCCHSNPASSLEGEWRTLEMMFGYQKIEAQSELAEISR